MQQKIKKIAVVGGDIRQLYLAKELSEMSYTVNIFGIDVNKLDESETLIYAPSLDDALSEADMLILPLPFSRDNITLNSPLATEKIMLSDLFTATTGIPHITSGMCDPVSEKILSENSVFTDYSLSEEFLIKNALATVEGAVALAIKETPRTLHGSICAVTGYGRIAKILVRTLISLGASVKVFARKSLDRTYAELDGAKSFDICEISENIKDVDVLFNTVPSVIIREKELSSFSNQGVIIELASGTGGIDKYSAAKNGVRTISAPSLPGKFSPQSAAEAIIESIFLSFAEKGVII